MRAEEPEDHERVALILYRRRMVERVRRAKAILWRLGDKSRVTPDEVEERDAGKRRGKADY